MTSFYEQENVQEIVSQPTSSRALPNVETSSRMELLVDGQPVTISYAWNNLSPSSVCSAALVCTLILVLSVVWIGVMGFFLIPTLVVLALCLSVYEIAIYFLRYTGFLHEKEELNALNQGDNVQQDYSSV